MRRLHKFKIQMERDILKIQKNAALSDVGMPDAQAMEKINVYAKSPLSAQEVYCFSVRLCDDLPDRDFERFDTAALPVLARLFLGKTGIVDHDWSADRQVARIYDTEVLCDDGVSFIRAQCYILRTQKNADLITEIEGGIKKEVSVGCAVSETRCSICGKLYGACEHHKGYEYGGNVCLAILCKPTDAYEFSFVAVPAQRKAGVMKAAEGGVYMTLQELVSKEGTPELNERLKALERQAKFAEECREALISEVVSLGLLLDFGADETILRKSFGNLSFEELSALKAAMAQKCAAVFPHTTQLPSSAGTPCAMEAAFII